jgi:hypothetical protein
LKKLILDILDVVFILWTFNYRIYHTVLKNSKMASILTVLNYMASQEAIQLSAFCAGFAWSAPTNRLVQFPFRTVFNGALGASFAGFCANIVQENIPPQFKPLFTLLLLASAVYYLLHPPCPECTNPRTFCKCLKPVIANVHNIVHHDENENEE